MKARTMSGNRNETRRCIRPHLGDVKLTKPTPLHLERLYHRQLRRSSTRHL